MDSDFLGKKRTPLPPFQRKTDRKKPLKVGEDQCFITEVMDTLNLPETHMNPTHLYN